MSRADSRLLPHREPLEESSKAAKARAHSMFFKETIPLPGTLPGRRSVLTASCVNLSQVLPHCSGFPPATLSVALSGDSEGRMLGSKWSFASCSDPLLVEVVPGGEEGQPDLSLVAALHGWS